MNHDPDDNASAELNADEAALLDESAPRPGPFNPPQARYAFPPSTESTVPLT